MKLLITIILLLCLMPSACEKGRKNETRIMGQQIETDLVIIFKPGTSHDQINKFGEVTIGIQIPGVDGFGLKNGIEGVLAIPMVCEDQDGVALKLRSTITEDQLTEIRSSINASPIVEKIYENVRPADVKCEH